MKKLLSLITFLLLVTFMFGCCKNPENNSPNLSGYEILCNQFKEENKTFLSGQIVFLGDSITAGYNLENAFSASSPLKTYNRGIGGDTTSGLYNRLKISAYDITPSKIFIMIGTNDFGLNKSIDETMQNYESILEDIKQKLPLCTVYVISIYPVSASHESRFANIETANARLQNIAASRSLTYIDMFSSLKNSSGELIENYTNDGLHLTNAGYSVVTSILMPYVLA